MLSTFARSDYGEQGVRQAGTEGRLAPVSPRQLSEEFRQTYLDTDRYLRPLEWYTNEFRAALGIDVYQHPFDKQNGFGRIQEEPYDVLILRTEMPDERKAELVAEFVGLRSLEMTSPAAAPDNRGRLPSGKPGDKTHYAAKYKSLKQSIVFPRAYLDAIVDSPHVEHFFTQDERDKMRSKYCGEVAHES